MFDICNGLATVPPVEVLKKTELGLRRSEEVLLAEGRVA
jgi:hypothetical protein